MPIQLAVSADSFYDHAIINKEQTVEMTMCKLCDKRGQHETVKCDICLTWMCWDCSSVNDDQHIIYVEKSEDVKGLIMVLPKMYCEQG